MKKVILSLLLCTTIFLASGICSHADAVSITGTLKPGVAYSLVDHDINYLMTLDVAQWKGFTLEAGYAGRAKNTQDKIVAVVSYPIFNAKKFGITWPVADLIDLRLGVYGGFGRVEVGSIDTMKGNNEIDAGVSLTAISFKF